MYGIKTGDKKEIPRLLLQNKKFQSLNGFFQSAFHQKRIRYNEGAKKKAIKKKERTDQWAIKQVEIEQGIPLFQRKTVYRKRRADSFHVLTKTKKEERKKEKAFLSSISR